MRVPTEARQLPPNRANLPEPVSASAMLGPLPCSNGNNREKLSFRTRNRVSAAMRSSATPIKREYSATFLRPKEAFPVIRQNRDLNRQNRALFPQQQAS